MWYQYAILHIASVQNTRVYTARTGNENTGVNINDPVVQTRRVYENTDDALPEASSETNDNTVVDSYTQQEIESSDDSSDNGAYPPNVTNSKRMEVLR